jgi:hypothetical protein
MIVADDHALFRAGFIQTLEANKNISVIAQAASGNEVIELVKKTDAEINLIIKPRKDSVFNIIVTRSGLKYAETPTVTIDAPGVGLTATAIANISNGQVSAIIVEEVGNGYISPPNVVIGLPFITFNGETNVSDLTDNISYINHPLSTGDSVLYTNGGGTTVSGLTNTTVYYVIKTGESTFRLAETLEDAIDGTYIPISGGLGDAHKLTLTNENERALASSTLGTGGEIVGYEIVNPGVGYTAANIQVFDEGAILTFNGESDVTVLTNEITIVDHKLIENNFRINWIN